MRQVKCLSGMTGWQERLQKNYGTFECWKAYAEIYGLAERLGFKTVEGAWKANPTIQGSVHPGDYRRVK